jgi:multidrug efflux pump
VGDRRDHRPVRVLADDVPLRAAAVLPGFDPAGADGGHRAGRGASLRSTQAQAEKLEKLLSSREGIANYVSYVGTGSPRFYLPLDQQLPATNFAQFVVLAKDIKSRESTRDWLLHEVIPKFPDVQMRVTRLENGPPVGYPVQFRISGEHIEKVQAIARQVEAKVREPARDERQPGLERAEQGGAAGDRPGACPRAGREQCQVSQFLSSSLAGQSVSVYREGNRQIEMLLRGPADERNQLELLSSLSMPTANGGSITLSQVATMEYGFEDGIIWHRNRLPTVTVRADISDGMQPLDVVHQILPTLDGIRAELPSGYLLETGGTVEDSARGQNSIKAGMPLFLVVVATLLMLQLRSFSRAAMVLVTAPLGIIGATLFLLLFRAPFGFVALLGTIALAGMIMRNSVILIDQIQQDIDAGHDRWHSIIDATVRRFRPIVLTALAAVLAMIPLSRSAFYGSMAISIMGGLIVGTVLTLVFLPALYAAWFRVKPDESGRDAPVLRAFVGANLGWHFASTHGVDLPHGLCAGRCQPWLALCTHPRMAWIYCSCRPLRSTGSSHSMNTCTRCARCCRCGCSRVTGSGCATCCGITSTNAPDCSSACTS